MIIARTGMITEERLNTEDPLGSLKGDNLESNPLKKSQCWRPDLDVSHIVHGGKPVSNKVPGRISNRPVH